MCFTCLKVTASSSYELHHHTEVINGLTITIPSDTNSQFRQLVIFTFFFLYVVSLNTLLTASVFEEGVCKVLLRLLLVFILPWKVSEPLSMLFAMVSTSLLLLAFVAPDGSPRLTTFSLLVCKVPVISEFHKIIKQFKRYAESSLPDGRCGPVSPSSLLGPCAPVSLLSCLWF